MYWTSACVDYRTDSFLIAKKMGSCTIVSFVLFAVLQVSYLTEAQYGKCNMLKNCLHVIVSVKAEHDIRERESWDF